MEKFNELMDLKMREYKIKDMNKSFARHEEYPKNVSKEGKWA